MNNNHARKDSDDERLASVGRYILQQPLARGGMATVHAARLLAAEGVTRLVAAKRLHPQYADDPEFVTMFHDEARIASRIHHPNVVPVLDVVREGDEVILVQEYVHGVPLSYLIKRAQAEHTPVPIAITVAIISGILAGLHAAHEATDDLGEPLGIVHRDVSPQNVLVSVDGVPRLVDFGIAKARTSEHHTREGFFKGKLSYMPPEQLRGEPVSRAADIYAAGVLLWELVVNRRFHDGKSDPEFVRAVASGSTLSVTEALELERDHLSAERWAFVHRVEPLLARAMAPSPSDRYATAAEMASALCDVGPHAPAVEVAGWVRALGAEYLERRQQLLLDDGARSGRLSDSTRPEGEVVRASGPRMRVDVVRSEAPISASIAPAPGTLTLTSGTGSWSERPIFSVRSLAPWALSAGLLVVIGVLAGMALRREPVAQPARTATFQRVDSPIAAEEPTVVPSTAATFEVEDSGAAQAPTATRPPPAPPTARASARPSFVAPPAPSRPVAAPVFAPAASAPAKDCNPPFYFEGTKKVFKPACI